MKEAKERLYIRVERDRGQVSDFRLGARDVKGSFNSELTASDWSHAEVHIMVGVQSTTHTIDLQSSWVPQHGKYFGWAAEARSTSPGESSLLQLYQNTHWSSP